MINDVAIVGAGPGGSAAAYYLARRGLNVLLLDKANFPRDKTCGDGLTPRSLAVLRDMGLLNELAQIGCRINRMAVYAPDGRSIAAPFPERDDGLNYSLIVPRLQLDNLVQQQALAQGAQFEAGVQITNLQRHADYVTLTGQRDGKAVQWQAKVVIIATGASISLLQNIGWLKSTPSMLLASRTYYTGLVNLQSDTIQVRFESVPLPGYGWVFPISPTAANVGVIFHPRAASAKPQQPASSRAAFAAFLQTPALKKQLHDAERAAPLKGFPVNTNFGSYATVATRFLLVGEAAGLVNPLTADGTDFALSSGKLAAAHILRAFANSDFSRQNLQPYDAALRQRYTPLFTSCRIARDWLNNPALFNQMLRGAAFAPAFNRLLMNILLG